MCDLMDSLPASSGARGVPVGRAVGARRRSSRPGAARRCVVICALTWWAWLPAVAAPEGSGIEAVFKPATDRDALITVDESVIRETTGGRTGPTPREDRVARVRALHRRIEQHPRGTGLRATYTYRRAAMTGRMGPWNLDFDSDKPTEEGTPPSPAAPILRAMVGQKFGLDFRADGTAPTAWGMEDLSDVIMASAPNMFVFAVFEHEFTNEASRFSYMDSLSPLYAGREVSAGDRWERVIAVRDMHLGDLEYHYDCTLEKVLEADGRPIAHIAYRARVEVPRGASPGVRIFMTRQTLKSGTIEGRAEYDPSRGEIVHAVEEIERLIEGLQSGTEPGTEITLDIRERVHRTYVLSDAPPQVPSAPPAHPAEPVAENPPPSR